MVSGKGYLKFLVGGLLLAAVVSCGTVSKTKNVGRRPVTYPALGENASQRFKYYYLDAIQQQEKGNYAAAFDLLNHCLEINPNAAEVYFTLANYDDALHQDSLTLRHLRKAVELSPENDAYAERLGGRGTAVGRRSVRWRRRGYVQRSDPR